MKPVLLIVAIVLTSMSVMGQTTNMGKSDPEAKKVLDAVSAKFKTFKAVQALFSFKNEIKSL